MKASTFATRRWLIALVALHLPIVCAGFVAPYAPAAQHRSFPYAPPIRLHLVDRRGHLHLTPFFYAAAPAGSGGEIGGEDRSRAIPIRWFARGEPYRLFGLFESSLHLFGSDPDAPLFVLGTDGLGRDQLSRWLAGGQVSLLAGLFAASLALGIGTFAGLVAGYFGGRVDELLMRGTDVFMALPWMYLLLAMRASLPLRMPPLQAFAAVVAAVGICGCVRPARMIRGLVLSARDRSYVTSARGFGAGDAYLMRAHILPAAYSTLLTQAAMLVPQFVVAEVILSFLGLGVADPLPSWGNLLAPLQQYYVLATCWWMFIPAVMSSFVFFIYYRFADALHSQLRPVAL